MIHLVYKKFGDFEEESFGEVKHLRHYILNDEDYHRIAVWWANDKCTRYKVRAVDGKTCFKKVKTAVEEQSKVTIERKPLQKETPQHLVVKD